MRSDKENTKMKFNGWVFVNGEIVASYIDSKGYEIIDGKKTGRIIK